MHRAMKPISRPIRIVEGNVHLGGTQVRVPGPIRARRKVYRTPVGIRLW